MAPKYKLTYFNIKALGEPLRFLFSYGGIEFEDNRIQLSEWDTVKPTMPYGKLPILEVDGKIVHQSNAIGRYLAKQVGLAGKDDWEALQIDSSIDTIYDLRLQCFNYYYEADEAIKAKYKETLKETVPYYLSRLDKLVEENGGHFVGGKLTWADLYFAGVHETLGHFSGQSLVENYPNLKSVVDKVYAVPAIKAWIDKSPVADY